MTLRAKTLSIIGATLIGLVAALYVASTRIVDRGYASLERASARRDAQRIRSVFDDAIQQLSATAAKWSSVDDTCAYLDSRNPDVGRSFNDAGLAASNVDAAVLVHRTGRVYLATGYDGMRKCKRPLAPDVRAYFSGPNYFVPDGTPESPRSGIVAFPSGPMFVCSRPVLHSITARPPSGTLILARAIGQDDVARAARLLQEPMAMSWADDPNTSKDMRAALAAMWPERWWTSGGFTGSTGSHFVLLTDVQGRPAVIIRATVDDDARRTGFATRRYLLVSLTLTSVIFVLVALLVLERLVLRRLSRLSRDLSAISNRNDFTLRVHVEGTDELGRVARDVNSALSALERTQISFQQDQQRDSDQRLAAIVETNASGILLVSLDGRIIYANQAAERIFGEARNVMTSRHYDDPVWTMPNGPAEGSDHPIHMVLTTGCPVFGVDTTIRHGDGGRVVLSVNASPLRDADGAITGVVASVSDVTERKALEERLAFQAYHDPLTSLPNRVLFRERLSRALIRARRMERSVGVLFVDLDNFKYINDSLGHATGDHLLTAVAERIQHCLRGSDTAARFGGDEFTVMVDDMESERDAVTVTERLLHELKKPFMLGAREVFISLSIGIAHAGGLDGMEADELLRNADAAMYEAKIRGKSRFEMFHAGMNSRALQRLETENDLRRAIERDELVVYFQPAVCLASGVTTGFEALVRWRHPKRGVIAPVDFIPLAEETGLVIDIGRVVLKSACQQALTWTQIDGADQPLMLGVNLSARQLQHPTIVADVVAALRSSGLPPERLALEITESAIIDEGTTALDTLNALKGVGVKLYIDDFGTGYSSLSYLRRFPLDGLKIDRSFVDGLGREPEDRLIVASTIDLAHGLGLTVIAEGAETHEQVEALRDLGCDEAQGYRFAKPMPAEEVAAYLAATQVILR
ncbi:MAG TPA: EAL domain-containing protein [Armatimonadota bacterium]